MTYTCDLDDVWFSLSFQILHDHSSRVKYETKTVMFKIWLRNEIMMNAQLNLPTKTASVKSWFLNLEIKPVVIKKKR